MVAARGSKPQVPAAHPVPPVAPCRCAITEPAAILTLAQVVGALQHECAELVGHACVTATVAK
jgi:hypothetical protein